MRDERIKIHVLEAGAGGPEFSFGGDFSMSDGLVTAVDEAWEEARAAAAHRGARLFDGPVLFMDMLAFGRRDEWACVSGRYRHVIAGEHILPGLRALGVQGVTLARDRDGDECVLMGRRGNETRVYAGLWENAPSGVIEPPVQGATKIGPHELLAALAKEGLEELGIDLRASQIDWPCLLEDAHANSIDVVARVRLAGAVESHLPPCRAEDANWEYADAAWVSIARLREWARASPPPLSPPTDVLFRWLGWA